MCEEVGDGGYPAIFYILWKKTRVVAQLFVRYHFSMQEREHLNLGFPATPPWKPEMGCVRLEQGDCINPYNQLGRGHSWHTS